MKLKSLLVMLSVLAVAGLANAQGVNAYIFWADDGQGVPEPPLTDLCAGGTPLPEQTTIIEIYWDNDSNGPDADDPQPVICNNPPECLDGPTGTVNLNSFPMTNAGPGYYFPDNTFNTTGIVPQPSRYYLRCCIGPRHWVSSVFILNAGFSDVGPSTYLPTPAVTYTWSCVEEPCAGCQLPPAVASFDASDNLCNGVQLTWAYADTNNAVDSLLISRDGALIAMVSDNAPDSYLDTGAPFNVNIAYQIEARRICTAPADTAYSPIQPATGFRTPAPPVPTNVTASDATCDNVTVSWSYTTNQGLGYWVIARNGDSVGTVAGGGTPGNRNFTHLNAPGGVAEYCVHGASASCGWGTPDCDNGNANIDPGQVQGVNATDGQCNTTVVTWTDLNTVEDNYFVTRDGTNISGSLGGDVTLYNDNSGAAGQVYAYRVVATNECGQGPASDSNNGSRITVPSQVTGVLATDNTLCDMVTVTWTNLTNETGYQIRRDNVAIDCVAVDVASYNDLSAVPGTIYQYIVVAKNTCGYGAFSNQNAGQRKAPPPQVTGVAQPPRGVLMAGYRGWMGQGEAGFREGVTVLALAAH